MAKAKVKTRKSAKKKCVICGREFVALSGAAKRCAAHRENKVRDRRRLEELAAKGSKDAAALLKEIHQVRDPKDLVSEAAHAELSVQRLAAALGLVGRTNPQAARALAVLSPAITEEVFAAMLIEAETKHRDLVDGRPSAAGAIVQRTLALAALRLAGELHRIPNSILPSAIKQLSVVTDALGGGGLSSFPEVTLKIPEPKFGPVAV